MSTDASGWKPNASDSSAPRCQNCGDRVLEGTPKVFGDENNVLWHCSNCVPVRDLKFGAGARPDYDPERDRGRTSDKHPIFPDSGGEGQ